MSNSTERGIVVLGFPRSGTTLLRRLLNAHPNISCPGETYTLSSAARFLEGEKGVDGLEVGVLSGLAFAGFDEEVVLGRLRDLIESFHVEHAKREGKNRWAEKTAVDVFHLEAIERIFGDHVTYLCLVRHGLDAAASCEEWCAKLERYPAELFAYVRQYPRPLEAFARAWADTSASLRRLVERRPENAMLLRYRDLVSEPKQSMQQVLSFLKEPWEEQLLERAMQPEESIGFSDWKSYGKSSIDNASIDRWKSISRGTLAELAVIVNPELEALGYAPIEQPAMSESEARRRYQLGLRLQSMRRPE